MQDAIERGWQSVTMDVDSFDFAFSRREDREIRQGGFRFGNAWWSSDATCRLGAGDLVNLRVPLRSNAEGIFVLHDSQRLDERALPDKQYHPLDRDGARESARRNKLQEQEIRRIRSYVDSDIDPATEILRGVNQTPLTVVAGATIGLDDAGPRHQELARIERQRAQMIEIAEDFGWAGYSQERRAEGN